MAGDHHVLGTDRLAQASQFSSNLAGMGGGRCVEYRDLEAIRHRLYVCQVFLRSRRLFATVHKLSPTDRGNTELMLVATEALPDLRWSVIDCVHQDVRVEQNFITRWVLGLGLEAVHEHA